ncbi:unnamed protein product [Brassica rapa]|uniref:Glycosyltransferase subfamily 4-like N-terminal domain-containing protein n=1 Tax=Brassica campestris TaxID=3711 RepID=A0A3P5ZE00_BRACM|nr:unnamed protein product [Brassica rapa]VDC78212.1 unnamed protein product [Brassica rapa]
MNLSSSSLSINLSPTHHPFLPSTTTNTNTCSSSSSATTCSPRCSFVSSPVSLGASCPRRLPVSLIRRKSQSFFAGLEVVSASSGSNDMTITEARGEGDESEIEAPLLDPESYSKPRRIALFVEPSPFAYVSGYKNRFQNFIRYLREMGDEVIVVTTHEGVPEEFYGAKVIGSRSFPCPYYQKVPLSLALSPRIISEIARFKPDIIHASSPGIMVFGALAIAKMLSVPIVMSYHTHVPVYIPRYTFSWLVQPMWSIIRFLHRAADLTLVPSAAIGKDLIAAGATAANQLRLWNKGVDSESFNPRFRSQEMRIRLRQEFNILFFFYIYIWNKNMDSFLPEKPLVIHVGRIGVEKSLELLKSVMDKLPEARIAFIGDGPYREDLEKLFAGMPAVFTGMLQGEELSQAYASGDVFVMPSESETLGLVVLEAMASGLPVVAARAGGIPDIIPEEQEGKTGFLFNPGDVEDCVTKLRTLLHDKETREIIGKAAREETEKYDWRAATTKIRNEQYGAAIWFWRKKKAQVLGPINWLVKRLFPVPPEVNA